MNPYPILIDSRPSYLGEASDRSLLLAPLAATTLIDYLASRLTAATEQPLMVLCDFEPTAEYEARLREACPRLDRVGGPGQLEACIERLEPSDWLLFGDPRCFPAEGFEPASLLRHPVIDQRWARHLVVLEKTPLGTRERIEFDSSGAVRRIQRYYEGVTWPFAAGVSCSLVPVAGLQNSARAIAPDLSNLRQALADRGVPGRDLPLDSGAFDLTLEDDYLALNESFVVSRPAGARLPAAARNGGAGVHPSARLLGPVAVQRGASIAEDAVVIGPTVIGAGARVERSAVVAQCVIGAGTIVGEGTTLRHRAVFTHVRNLLPAIRDAQPPKYRGPGTATEPQSDAERLGTARASFYARHKWIAEAVLATLGLVVLSPLLLLAALLIKLESRGPVFFGHKREGKDGRVFSCWKFRTMFTGAESRERELVGDSIVDGPQFKLTRDPRVTRMGHVLRPTSLDELPQLINVALGQMSLVGPRPSPFRENQVCIPWRQGRLSVRPGITGLWQVCRHDREAGDFHQWIDYDLLYVRNVSAWLDVKILIATLVTLGGRSSVPVESILSASATRLHA